MTAKPEINGATDKIVLVDQEGVALELFGHELVCDEERFSMAVDRFHQCDL